MNKPTPAEGPRRSQGLAQAQWQPMSIAGKVLQGIEWAVVAGAAGWEAYWMKMAPGSCSVPHVHTATEVVLVLQGEVIDSDGEAFVTGDSLVYAAGSDHWLKTTNGCTLFVIESAPALLSL